MKGDGQAARLLISYLFFVLGSVLLSLNLLDFNLFGPEFRFLLA